MVVKADAYGHGATQVARARRWRPGRPNWVATIDEALSLRRDGITAPVLAWLHPPGTDFRARADRRVQIGVSRCGRSRNCSTRSTAPAAPPS